MNTLTEYIKYFIVRINDYFRMNLGAKLYFLRYISHNFIYLVVSILVFQFETKALQDNSNKKTKQKKFNIRINL